MHRRLLKPLATVMGAAALMVAPIALAAPASAVSIVAAPITPDETWEHDPDYNDPTFWEEWIYEDSDGEVVATCIKEEEIDKPYTIPAIDTLFEFEEGDSAEDFEYVLAVLKGGANQEGNEANELYFYPSAGDELSHATSGNSHVILCIAESEDETPPPSTTPPVTTPPVTGPVVETDRVADTGPVAGLGLAAGAAALVAGMGAMLFSRRRQGNYR
jgi:hypothetical protein